MASARGSRREALQLAAQAARELDRAGIARRLVERAEDLHQPRKAGMIEIEAEIERAARPRDVADDMRMAVEQLQVGVDGGGLPVVLQSAAQAERAKVPATRQLGRDNAQHALELRPVHVEGELPGGDVHKSFDHAAEIGRGAAEITDAELTDRHLAVLQRAGQMHVVHRLAVPGERLGGRIQIDVEAGERAPAGRRDRGRRRRRRGGGRGRDRPRQIGIETEPVGGHAQADAGSRAQQHRRRAAEPRRVEGPVDVVDIQPIARQGEVARQRRLAQPVGGDRLQGRAEPAAEAAEIVGCDFESRLGARPIRRQRAAAAQRQGRAARQLPGQAAEREPATGKHQLQLRVADEAAMP